MKVGLALAEQSSGLYAVGYDVRLSSPLLAQALLTGINAGGSDVVSLGLAPTPAVAFYSRGKAGGAIITASHNPPEYNGIKIFDQRGASIPQSGYTSLLSRSGAGLASWNALGNSKASEGLYRYIEDIASAYGKGRGWRVGLDPGNGATTVTAPLAFTLCGTSVSTMNLAPDGTFPGRGSEPDETSLSGLSELVRARGLEIGFGFDGDGDRVAVVDEKGKLVPPDLALGFVAAQSVSANGGGTVVANIDVSAIVDLMVESAGGKVVRSKVGDTYVLEELMKSGGVFGGEGCGAWIHPDKSPCPDGVLSALIFMDMLEESHLKPSQVGSGLPEFHLTRRKLICPDELRPKVMASVKELLTSMLPGSKFTEMDGIRADMPDRSWVLVRPSGTEPLIRVTAESVSESRSYALASQVVDAVEQLKVKLR